jgi:hypothetical protein
MMLFNSPVKLFLAATCAIGIALPVCAADLGEPKGDVVLTVSGNLTTKNRGDTAVLDREMLEAMPITTIETTTIWTGGSHVFQGVLLKDLVDTLGITGSTLKATAINDYAIEIPLSDAVEGGPIIAYLLDGNEMSLREKGPLWVIYPYDASADYRKEIIYSRSIWQLDRITALD